MTIVDGVWRWPYELKDISLQKRQILRPGSNLFYSLIVDGKNEFLQKLWFALKRGMFNAFLVEHNVRLTGITLKR